MLFSLLCLDVHAVYLYAVYYLPLQCSWGLQALYISWLTPSAPETAPATASFLSGLGFCGLEPSLMQALQSSGQDNSSGVYRAIWCADDTTQLLFHRLLDTICGLQHLYLPLGAKGHLGHRLDLCRQGPAGV